MSVATSRVTGVSTALYRRYRPETFAEVIGQDHVTAPLMQALRSGRVNHAYLFSGPRGCGKTTSARILARTLNCAQNTPEKPLDTPCGQCPSCVELARGGPGSLDVVEIDAASHNGVDDARELRERAAFAPARDRYKIFILDEAHMVTPQGFNALLKLVEEPPEHVKFVFATTEPDKVIGTIRSRTHHYPFRLVPPDVLGPYLDELCAAEGVTIGSGVVPLVTRAGGGSVRDSLSVMDQLIAGAEGGVVEYERAVSLLGFTHATLLDDVVDALAARDGASIFRVVDQVVATGHEPRRFVEDVLERLRDLIVIAVSGDEAQAVLRDQPADQLERMRAQAQHLGVAELSRAADLANAALTEMTGATSPRLHLELLMARLLLPGADDGAAGFAARLDRLERGGIGAGAGVPVAASSAPGRPVPDDAGSPAPVASPGQGLSGPAAVRAALRTKGPAPTGAAEAAPIPAVAAEPAPTASAAEPAPAPDATTPATPAAPTATPAARTATPASQTATPAATPVAPTAEPAPDDVRAPAEGDGAAVPSSGPATAPATEPATSVQEPAASADVRAAAPTAPTAEPPSAVPGRRRETDEVPAVERPASSPAEPASATPAAGVAMTTEEVRRRWPEVLEALRASPVTWSLVSANAQVAELARDVLYLAFPSPGLARTFSSSRHTGAVQDVVYQTLGLQLRVEPRLAEDGPTGGSSGPASPETGPGLRPGSGRPTGGSVSSTTSPTSPAAGDAGTGPASAGATAPSPVAGSPVVASPGAAADAVSPVAAVVGSVAAPSGAGGAAPRVSTVRGAVALQERPVSVEPVPDVVVDVADEAWLAGAPAPTPPPAPAADDAWVAGAPVAEPPADLDDGPEPEPVLEPASRPTSLPAASLPSSASAPAGPRPAPSRPGGTPPLRGASAARAAIAAATSARTARPTDEPVRRSAPAAVDPMDDIAADDDVDITSTGLVGTALVVSLLQGKIIEEIQDQG